MHRAACERGRASEPSILAGASCHRVLIETISVHIEHNLELFSSSFKVLAEVVSNLIDIAHRGTFALPLCILQSVGDVAVRASSAGAVSLSNGFINFCKAGGQLINS